MDPDPAARTCAGLFANPTSTRDPWIAALLSVIFLVLTYPWIYQGSSFGEPDSEAIAAGIHQAILGGRYLGEPLFYLPSGHPLYYFLFLRWPGAAHLDDLISLMHHVSWLSMGGVVGLSYVLCRRFTRPGWAVAAVVAIASSPTTFELATYGHPVTPALLSFMFGGAVLLATVALGTPANARGVTLVALATAFVTAAICTRADVVLFLPALLALAHAVCPSRRTLVAAGLTLAGALAVYLLWKRLMPDNSHSAGPALQQLREFLSLNYRLRRIRLGLASFCVAAGPGLSMTVAGAVVWLALRRAWSPLLYGACMVLPTFAFFVANPYPLRHFLYAIIGCGFFLAMAAARLLPPRSPRSAIFIPAVLALNLGIIPLAGAIARARNWEPPCSVPSASCWLAWNMTHDVFERHRTNEHNTAWGRARWEQLSSALLEGSLLIGTWEDQAWLRLFSSERGQRIVLQEQLLSPDSDWITVAIDGRTFYFWMRVTGDSTNPPFRPPGPVHILAPYPAADLARLPLGPLDATSARPAGGDGIDAPRYP